MKARTAMLVVVALVSVAATIGYLVRKASQRVVWSRTTDKMEYRLLLHNVYSTEEPPLRIWRMRCSTGTYLVSSAAGIVKE